MKSIFTKSVLGFLIVLLLVNYINNVVSEISGKPSDSFFTQIFKSYIVKE
ncbi:MAG: hypothetical protein IKJ06_01415 [Clostridia bacterium]|nr:hypothetical protein [Clostridia bacterium]